MPSPAQFLPVFHLCRRALLRHSDLFVFGCGLPHPSTRAFAYPDGHRLVVFQQALLPCVGHDIAGETTAHDAKFRFHVSVSPFPSGWLIFLFQYTIPCAEKQNPAFFIVFLSFTHEKQHFMQFCLLDSPQKCYNCINRTSIFFQHPKEVFVCSLIVSLRCVFWVAPSIRGGGY